MFGAKFSAKSINSGQHLYGTFESTLIIEISPNRFKSSMVSLLYETLTFLELNQFPPNNVYKKFT